MAILDIFRRKKTVEEPVATVDNQPTPQAAGFVENGAGWGYNRVYPIIFDGEKDFGEMGNIRQYIIDHTGLRLRSQQLYIDSDVCQALFNRSAMWGIGSGLKLQASPQKKALGIDFDIESFNENIEALFNVWGSTPSCDWSESRVLGEIATEGWVNKDIGGDVLLIMRLENGIPKVEIIDGMRIRTPALWGSESGEVINPDNNNRIRHGVEIDDRNRTVAYYVFTGIDNGSLSSYRRVEARMSEFPYSETAKMVYGLKYRIDSSRGIPLITAVMETAAKMGRYREAVIGTAEELSKITYQVTHESFSDGSNPVQAQLSVAAGFANPGLPTDTFGEQLANQVAVTTNKQTFNNPPGAKIEPVEKGNGELYFRDFYEINFDLVCAVAGYPPEVIMSKYNSNYSASRAAIKDFEHTLEVKRKKFASQFYQVIYNFCLDVWVLQGKVELPGYREALLNRDEMKLAAYRNVRFVGDAVPHIDPYKEIQAIRAMLPKDMENLPLITAEGAVEMLGNGDYKDVLEQFAKEWQAAESKGIEKAEKTSNQNPNQPNGNPAKQKVTQTNSFTEKKYVSDHVL